MARARLLWKSLSTSVRFGRLFDLAPEIAEFAQSLYPLLNSHADDFGRGEGDVETVKYRCNPRSPRSEEDFERALAALHLVGLIVWYDAEGRCCYEICKFYEHQSGLHKRTKSQFPEPPEVPGKSRNVAGIPSEEKRREEKRVQEQRSAPLALWQVRRHLRSAIHQQLKLQPEIALGELMDYVKGLCRPLHFTFQHSGEIAALCESVLGERARDRRRA